MKTTKSLLRLIVLTIAIVVTTQNAFGQVKILSADSPPPYRPWATFNADTTAYLEYNFEDRFGAYLDQPLKKFFNDLEFDITAIEFYVIHNQQVLTLILYVHPLSVLENIPKARRIEHFFVSIDATPATLFKIPNLETKKIYKWEPQYEKILENVIAFQATYVAGDK